MAGFRKLREKNDGAVRAYDLTKPSVKLGYTLMFAVCLVILLLCVMPLVWVICTGFKDIKEFNNGIKIGKGQFVFQLFPDVFSFDGYVETWKQMKFFNYYLNSFYVVIGSVVSALIFNGLLAYGLSRLKPHGYKLVHGLIMLSLMLPATTSLVPLFINLTNLGLTKTFLPLWLCIGANAFYVILFKSFYDDMPDSLLEAARLDGCNDFSLFFKIVMPLSMPINIVIIIYAVTASWSDFLLPYLVLNNTKLETVMVRLFAYRTSLRVNTIDIIRAIVFSIIPPIIIFILFQRQITQNVMSAGIKG